MTPEQEMVQKNLIYKVKAGSHLYGLNTPESDRDYIGVFVPDRDYLLGLRRIERVTANVVDKDDSGKNTSEAVDCVYYSIYKFMSLAMKGNPNIIETLYAGKNEILYKNELGDKLLSIREAFLSQAVTNSVFGYITSIRKKMLKMAREGIDIKHRAKSLSHMYRLTVLLGELLGDRRINLPLKGQFRDIAISIKQAKTEMCLSEYNRLTDLRIEWTSNYAEDEEYKFPKKPNVRLIEKTLIEIHESAL